MSQRCDLLVRNAAVWTVDAERRTYAPGAIAISGNRIVDVGPDHEVAQRVAASATIDAGGGIAHPGFVEAHTHVSMHLTREAFADARNSSGYFSLLIRSLNELTPEDENTSALLAAVEMLRSGTTTFADPGSVAHIDAVAEAVERAGIRGLLADPFVWDLEDHEWTAGLQQFSCDESAAYERLGGQLWRNQSEGLVRGHIALWGMATASDRLLLAAKSRAKAAGVSLTMHQSMESRDVARDVARLGCSPVQHFERIGFLGRNISLVHMNRLTSEDVGAMAGSGASVVWIPGNFLYYSLPRDTASPVPELKSLGVNLALGTDVAKAWGYGEQGLLGYLAVRADGGFLPAESLLEMATIGGAKALGLAEDIGSIETGKIADLVLRDPALPELVPGVNPARNLMLGVRSKGVRTVIVNGAVVVEDGHVTTVDERQVARFAGKRARTLIDRIA